MAMDRLQKVLASMGVASRRRCELLIVTGKVSVNGTVASLGQRVDPDRDEIFIDGELVKAPPRSIYLALNKPTGFVTSARSTHGERTIMELVPDSNRVFPVGRLDKETSGLLLLTNDGAWANIVTHPRHGIEKEYEVLVQGMLSGKALERLQTGIILPDGTLTAPVRVEIVDRMQVSSRLFVTVIEGKKRQIRLMAAAVGHPVRRLRRIRIGPIYLDDLPEAGRRELRAEEVDGIRVYGSRASAGGPSAPTEDRHRRAGGSG